MRLNVSWDIKLKTGIAAAGYTAGNRAVFDHEGFVIKGKSSVRTLTDKGRNTSKAHLTFNMKGKYSGK